TALAIFASPFGPDVLVATDELSEGIDLHNSCRLLVHYELDPSPIRTIQRQGRLRRVNGWAALTKRKIEYAFPAYGNTRDHRLVEIMKKRVMAFDLLLGGVRLITVDETDQAESDDEAWRQRVLKLARPRMPKPERLAVIDGKTGCRKAFPS
ncbi:MAG: helicase-related protein, partial [Candidatus Xenobia bacterium]